MGRKTVKNKHKKLAQAPSAKANPHPPKVVLPTTNFLTSREATLISIFFLGLAFVLYANTFKHRFVLDDHGIIVNNKITKAPVSLDNIKLIFNTPLRRGDVSNSENSLYRPFTKLALNIQWNIFDGNPHHFHKMNVFFYGILCMLIFWVLYDLFNKKWLLPFFITLLFTVHPIHTEVVANIKSLDEIMAMLGILLAMRAIQLSINTKKLFHLSWGVLAFTIGLYSKESAVVAMAIFPLLVYYQSEKFEIKKLLLVCIPFLVVAVFFIYTRHEVLSQFPPNAPINVMDNLIVAVKDNLPMRIATPIMIVGFYIYTFVVPHPLACDYSYATLVPVNLAHWGFVLSFLLCLASFIYAIIKLPKKNKIGFGILWFFITFSLASNVFFLIGTSFGERLLFLPSLGLCIISIGVLAHFFDKNEGLSIFQKMKASPVFLGIIFLVSVVYSIKTIARNKDWHSDYELFSRDIKYNSNATHLLYYMGNHLPSEDRKEFLSEQLRNLGLNQTQINDSILKEVSLSIDYFRRSLAIYPALPPDGYNQLGKAYFIQGQLDSAKKYYEKALMEDTTSGIYTNNVGTVYFNRNQLDKALPYFRKAHNLDTTEADFLNNIGSVYGQAGMGDSAIYYFLKAQKADSLDLKSLQFLDMTYRIMGDTLNADYYKRKSINVQQLRMARF